MVTLEKIDKIVQKTGCTFEAARDAIKITNGNLVEAINYIDSDITSQTAIYNKCKLEKTCVSLISGALVIGIGVTIIDKLARKCK